METDIDIIKADITACQGQVKRLQYQTVECVSFAASGKVTVTDKDRLESLNSEVDRLAELVGHNEAVLSRLQECLQKVKVPSIAELVHSRGRCEDKIADYKIGANRTIGTWLKVAPNYTLETIREHPRVKPELEKYEAWIPEEETKLKHFSEVLAEAKTIIAEFRPSGLPEIKQKTRSAAVAQFDMPAKGAVF